MNRISQLRLLSCSRSLFKPGQYNIGGLLSKRTAQVSPAKAQQPAKIKTAPATVAPRAARTNKPAAAQQAKARHADGSNKTVANKPEPVKKPSSVGQAKVVPIPQMIRARELSRLLNVRYQDLCSAASSLLSIKVEDPEQELDQDVASLIAMEYDYLPENSGDGDSVGIGVRDALVDRRPAPTEEERIKLSHRAPVVTIMGHVDHGKTTLLDSLRKTSVALNEAGGITQHIGAFSVVLPSNRRITFLDTPGHAAFTSMRARGAKVTDIVVLVVAADDGVMPQTIEAIHHAKAANVPVIVAVNKCDKPDSDIDKVLYKLMEHGIEPEKFGGDVQCIPVSALKGTGLKDLEESILLQADLMDLRGDSSGMCETTVIESKMTKGKGAVATVLIERGTLKTGDVLIFGNGKSYCKVRSITDENGIKLPMATPSSPCEISGAWSSVPQAGDEGVQVKSELKAREVTSTYETQMRQQKSLHDLAVSGQRKMVAKGTLEMKRKLYESKKSKLVHMKHMRELYGKYMAQLRDLEQEIRELEASQATNARDSKVIKKLHVVIKADVHGSLEAVIQSLQNIGAKLNTYRATDTDSQQSKEEFILKILHSSVGSVTPSDIDLLVAAKRSNSDENVQCALIGFNIPKMPKDLMNTTKTYKIPQITHNIIYNLIDDVKQLATGMITPRITYETVGDAQVLAVFNISDGKEVVAGCRVLNGTLYRNKNALVHSASDSQDGDIIYRVMRDDKVVFTGPLRNMKHHKNDVPSIQKGMECGLSFGDQFRDIQQGDKIICVQEVTVMPDF